MTVHPTAFHSESRTLANLSDANPSTWTLTKLTRAFSRYFADERLELSSAAIKAGEIVGHFLFHLSDRKTFRSASTRAQAVAAIDNFIEARQSKIASFRTAAD